MIFLLIINKAHEKQKTTGNLSDLNVSVKWAKWGTSIILVKQKY